MADNASPEQGQSRTVSERIRVDDPASLREALIALGSESPTERAAKRVVPWFVAIMLHVGVLVLGFMITWSVVMMSDDRDSIQITADFDTLSFDPVAVVDHAMNVTDDRVLTPVQVELIEDPVDDPLDIVVDTADLLPEALTGSVQSDFAPPPVRGSASFLGVSSTNAKRIVYVIDASGGMIPYLKIILKELARSLEGLSGEQSFGIIFFQRNEALMVPPRNRLLPALPEERARMFQWIEENVIPAGRSNPLAAFEVAIRLEPDVIFLLSDNITGSGHFEIDQRDLLNRLEQLNPEDRLTGRRRTQINCIQFLDPDPLDTLRIIAEEHGGENGYRFLSRAELGLAIQ